MLYYWLHFYHNIHNSPVLLHSAQVMLLGFLQRRSMISFDDVFISGTTLWPVRDSSPCMIAFCSASIHSLISVSLTAWNLYPTIMDKIVDQYIHTIDIQYSLIYLLMYIHKVLVLKGKSVLSSLASCKQVEIFVHGLQCLAGKVDNKTV